TGPSRVAVRVDGNVHDGSMPWERFVSIRAGRLAQRELHVRVDGESYAFPQEALGYELDRGRLDESFEEQRQQGGAAAWARLISDAPPPELPLTFALDEDRARAALESLGRAVRREPVDAQVLIRDHQVIQ